MYTASGSSPLEDLNPRRDLPAAVWLGLPLASLALRLLTPLLGEARWMHQMRQESGIVETLTVIFLLPAIVLGVLIFLRRRELPRGVGWLMLLGAVAALYFAGEEASWGQHWLGYNTPECVAQINDQGEFNLHNIKLTKHGWAMDLMDGLLNNAPRQMMLVASLVGGIILPIALWRRLSKPEAPRRAWYWLIPNYRLVLISAMAVFLRLPHRLTSIVASPPNDSYLARAVYRASGEFKEYCYALVILLYLLSVYLRMGPRKAARPPADAGGN